MLSKLSLELVHSARDIQALSTANLCSPHLKQLIIQLSPQWPTAVNLGMTELPEPLTVAELFGRLPGVLQEQLRAIHACLQALSRHALDLCVLSALEGGSLHEILPSFQKLTHLILDLWVPNLSIDWVHKLPCLVTLRLSAKVNFNEPYESSDIRKNAWTLDLQPLTSLQHFSVMGHLPSRVWLPEFCQLHVGDTADVFGIPMVDPWETDMAPWLTRMEVARCSHDYFGLPEILDLDLHLAELTLWFTDLGSKRQPFDVSKAPCRILRQAKQVTMRARDIIIHIPPDVKLAWVRIRMVAKRRLLLSYKKPEVLLSGRATVMLQYSQTNLGNVHVMWRPMAQRLGLSITKRDWESEGKAMYALCLTKGSKEDERFLQAPCICRACMECLEYYGMLK